MIDIHCHILPNLDDGPKTIESSLEMARQAAEDGIHTIVATPHVKSPYLSPEEIQHSISIFQNRLDSEKIPIKILYGGDVDALSGPERIQHYTINHTPYVLVEFPHTHWPAQVHEILYDLISIGLIPIITHPERNPGILRKPKRLLSLLDTNIKVQITADSLTGQFGDDCEACARFLIKKGAVAFLATDAHSPEYRRPLLSKGLKVATKILGKQKAFELVEDNPAAVIEGRDIL